MSIEIDIKRPLAEAIDQPRLVLGRTWGAARIALRMEPRFADGVVDALQDAGHDVEVLDDAYSDVMGHAGTAASPSLLIGSAPPTRP